MILDFDGRPIEITGDRNAVRSVGVRARSDPVSSVRDVSLRAADQFQIMIDERDTRALISRPPGNQFHISMGGLGRLLVKPNAMQRTIHRAHGCDEGDRPGDICRRAGRGRCGRRRGSLHRGLTSPLRRDRVAWPCGPWRTYSEASLEDEPRWAARSDGLEVAAERRRRPNREGSPR